MDWHPPCCTGLGVTLSEGDTVSRRSLVRGLMLGGMAAAAALLLVMSPGRSPTGQAFGNEEGCAGGDDVPEAELPELGPAALPSDGSWDGQAVGAQAAAEGAVTAFEGPLADLVNEAYAASGRPLEPDVAVAIVPRARFEEIQSALGHQLEGRRVGGLTMRSGGRPAIVIPADLPAPRFIEVFQHEVGHVREMFRGEHEPELAELVQALAVARLEPRVGVHLLEKVLEIPRDSDEVTENAFGHAYALHLLAETGIDPVKAYAAMEDYDPEAAEAALKAACGCADPAGPGGYRVIAARFLEVLAEAPELSGAAEGALDGVVALLSIGLERQLGRADQSDGDAASRERAIAQLDRYLERRSEAGPYHARVVHAGIRLLRAAAKAGELGAAERLALHRRVLDINGPYAEADEPDHAYVASFANGINDGWELNDPESVAAISDLFVERHGREPEPDLLRQVAITVFGTRGLMEQRHQRQCEARPWFAAAVELGCPGGACPSEGALASLLGTAANELDLSAHCDGAEGAPTAE